jgi:thiol-disulfide isomerase/thioredoxin
MRRRFTVLPPLALLCSFTCYAAEPLPAADPVRPAADELVKAVEASEQWLHQAESFYAKFDVMWSKTPEAIEHRRAALKKQFPGTEISDKRFTELLPESPETLVVAFDKRRFYKRVNQPASSDRTSFWDGSRAVAHEKYFSHNQEHYAVLADPQRLGRNFLGEGSWPRAAHHSFWWNPQAEERGYRFDPEGAQVWKVAGREKYHGTDCWVVEKEYGWTKWYVGVERPLLYGLVTYVTSNRERPGDRVALETARRFDAPATVTTAKDFYEWKKSLPKERAAEVQEAFVRALFKHARPLAEHVLSDYKEVRPGWWFPMSQGYDVYDDVEGGRTIVSVSRRFKTVELKVDEPLPDELFKMEFAEGVDFNDWSHDPPLFYKYKKHFTDAEWAAIVDRAKQNKAFFDKQKAEQDALVGKAAPPFPAKARWLNGGALSWEKLKGRPVVIDFFADWCGPCRNDLPTMAALYKDREKLPFVVIGVHPPGSDPKSVAKLVKEFELNYPICVDVPHGDAWGELFAAYAVKAIPHAVVVDADGKVAGQGSLGEMVGKAHELAAAASPK